MRRLGLVLGVCAISGCWRSTLYYPYGYSVQHAPSWMRSVWGVAQEEIEPPRQESEPVPVCEKKPPASDASAVKVVRRKRRVISAKTMAEYEMLVRMKFSMPVTVLPPTTAHFSEAKQW